jgi:hypothetical protein
VKTNFLAVAVCLTQLGTAPAQTKDQSTGISSQPASPSNQRLTIPPEPIAPNGFDFGRISKQGELNEYRIGKLEEDMKKIDATIDNAKGAWWAIGGAFAVFITLFAIGFKFLGKHIARELVEHYVISASPPVPSASPTAPRLPPA